MFERIDREEVFKIVSQHGPLVPVEVRKKLGKGETTMIGAVLSELVHHKRVAMTDLKRGSSPFYYDPNKPSCLEKAAQYLGEKDKRTFDLLHEKRAIDQRLVDPLTRVSLSQIKDFSRTFDHEGETYFRYYLTSVDEAKQILFAKQPNDGVQNNSQTTIPKTQSNQQITKEQTQEPSFDSIQNNTHNQQESANKSEQSSQHIISSTNKEQQTQTSPQIFKKETTIKKSQSQKQTKKKTSKESTQLPLEQNQEKTDEQKTLVEIDDLFYDQIKQYCAEKNITILSAELIRKNQELDLVLRVPSAIGRMSYFCKARNKKKSNDADVAAAMVAGQVKRLPTLYLTTGEVTKKAKEMTKKELKGVIIKEIGA